MALLPARALRSPDLSRERMEPFVVYDTHQTSRNGYIRTVQHLYTVDGLMRVRFEHRSDGGYVSISVDAVEDDFMMGVCWVSMQPVSGIRQSSNLSRPIVSTGVEGIVRELMYMYASDPLV